jgi:uncharacterized protein involved in exopolysaccharide biosynthesis
MGLLMSQEAQAHTPPASLSRGDYIVLDVLQYLYEIWRRKFTILLWVIVGAVASYGYSYHEPKLYDAYVRFIPPTRTSGLGFFSMIHSYGDEYRAMLTSNTVAFDVIEHQGLIKYLKVENRDQARGILAGMARFDLDYNGFVVIDVRSDSPDTSVRIANEFYAALYRLNEQIAVKEAEHRLKFVSGPLELERAHLAEAEDALRAAQEKTGLVLPGAQASLGVQQVAGLQQRISDLQLQLATARVGATDENPQVVSLRSQIGNLQGQLSALQRKSTQSNSPANLPQLTLEIQRLERVVQGHAATLEALSRAGVSAETQDSYTPSLTLIDPAIPNKNKVSPDRKQFALVGLVLGFALGLIHVLGSALYRRWKRSPHALAMMAQWNSSLKNSAAGPGHGD